MSKIDALEDELGSSNYASRFLSYEQTEDEEDLDVIRKKKSTGNRRYSASRMSVTKRLKDQQEKQKIFKTSVMPTREEHQTIVEDIVDDEDILGGSLNNTGRSNRGTWGKNND